MNLRGRTQVVTALFAMLVASGTAVAGIVVKQVDSNGRITYTDNPDPKHVILAQYRESGSTSIEQPASAGVAQSLPLQITEGSVTTLAPVTTGAPVSDVERALRSFTRLSTPLALTVDSAEAARRLHDQSKAARNGTAVPGLVFINAAPDARTDTRTPPGLAARIFSPLFYLVVSLGVGFMAYLVSRILLNGLLPLCRELFPRLSTGVSHSLHDMTMKFDRWLDNLPSMTLRN